MVTDPVQIQRQGAAKSAENLEFRRYLAAHHQRVAAFQAVAVEVQRHIDCTACANCCRYSIVSVRAAEVAGIAAYLGIGDDEVVAHFTTRDEESPRARTLKSGKEGQSLQHLPGAARGMPQFSARGAGNALPGWAAGVVMPLGFALSGGF